MAEAFAEADVVGIEEGLGEGLEEGALHGVLDEGDVLAVEIEIKLKLWISEKNVVFT